MNVFDYLKSIKKRFTRRDVASSIDTINAELTNVIIPLFTVSLAWAVKDDSEIVSTFYQNDRDSIMKDFAKSGYLRPSNPFRMILASLQNTVSILSYLSAQLVDKKAENMAPESITLSEATMLQLVDLCGFVSRYTTAWVELIVSAESNEMSGIGATNGLTPLQIKYLGDNRAAYGMAISILATPLDKITEAFEKMPELVIQEVNPKAITGAHGSNSVDPLNLNLVQSKWDPIYLISMMRTDYNAMRYKTIREEAASIELRIARLKKQMENSEGDTLHLASIIEKRQGQLDAKRGKLYQMEKSVR